MGPQHGGARGGCKIALDLLAEWSDFVGEAEHRKALYEIDCEKAKRLQAHSGACFAGGRKRRVTIPYPNGERTLAVTADDVWHLIGDSEWEWNGLPMLQRLDVLSVCKPGFCNVATSPRLKGAQAVARRHARAEAYGWVPAEPPATESLMRALDTIRGAQSDILTRKQRDLEKKHTGGT